MLSDSINSCLSHIKGVFNSFGIDFTTHFAKGLSYESLHSAAKNARAFNEVLSSTQSAIQEGSFLSLLYSYGPLRHSDDKPINSDIMATLPMLPMEQLPTFGDLTPYEPTPSERRYLPGYYIYYDGKTSRDLSDFYPIGASSVDTRLSLPFSIDLELVFLTGSTDLINAIQFLLLAHFRKKLVSYNLPMSVNGSDYDLPHHYIVTDGPNDVGFISYQSFGTLQKLTFSVSLSGLMLSPFVSETDLLEFITLELGIDSPSVDSLRAKF